MKNLKEMFAQMKTEIVAKNESKETAGFGKEDFIKFSPGNTYKFKLLFYVPDDSTRTTPWVNLVTHSYFNEDNREFDQIVCPTSEHISGTRGYKECKICGELNKLWSDYEKTGNETSLDIYRKFKRKINNYILVYVLNDPTNEANNNTVKIMRYGKEIQKFMEREILGGADEEGNSVEAIGLEAFGVKDSYDLLITVDLKQDFNNYTLKFSRNKSTANISEADVTKLALAMDLDNRFRKPFNYNLTNNFYSKFFLAKEEDTQILEPVNSDKPVQKPEGVKPAEPKPIEPKKVEKVEVPAEATPTDLDDLLKDLDL